MLSSSYVSREYPRYPLVGVGAIVIRDTDEILLIKRGTEPSKGKWSIPGGMIEVGESSEDAVLRELREETGIVGKVRGLFGVYQYIERDVEGKVKYHFILLDYLVDNVGGELKASTDALEARFYKLADVSNLDLTDTTRQLIQDLLSAGFRSCGGCLIRYVST